MAKIINHYFYPQHINALTASDNEEILKLERTAFRHRAQQRMEKCWSESDTNSEINKDLNDTCVSVTNRQQQMLLRQPDALSESSSKELDSITLPILGSLPNDVSISIKGSGIYNFAQQTKAEVAVKQYVERIVEDRNMATLAARRLRDKVDHLQLENEKLKYEMQVSTHRIRSFWRNKIAEAGTRTGICIQKALH